MPIIAKVSFASSTKQQFGYFASIELARLECIVGDYGASLKALSVVDIYDRSEHFETLPQCHVNVFYHAGISQLMLRRYTDSIDTFSNAILYISRTLKPGVAQV
jgi:translation initiation factor 3 subunit L